MTREVCLSITGMLTAGFGVLAQTVPLPGIPDDFKTWPVTAIIGFLGLASLALAAYAVKCMMQSTKEATRTAIAQAENMAAVSAKLTETNAKINALVNTQQGTNQIMIATNAELRARPCMIATGRE